MEQDLKSVVREVILKVADGGITDAKEGAERLRPLVPAGQPHRGKEPDDFAPDTIVEWYAGEFLDIVDTQSWYAMKSLINCLDKFCPEET